MTRPSWEKVLKVKKKTIKNEIKIMFTAFLILLSGKIIITL
jgi:hypothetical protein